MRLIAKFVAATVLLGASLIEPAFAAGNCMQKAAIGEAGSEQDAKLQVDEALLQAVDWGAWSAWMSSNSKVGAAAKLPGFSYGARKYNCKAAGSWGWTCRGSATICKL